MGRPGAELEPTRRIDTSSSRIDTRPTSVTLFSTPRVSTGSPNDTPRYDPTRDGNYLDWVLHGSGKNVNPGKPPIGPTPPREGEQREPDPFMQARAALKRFIGASSPDSIIREAARDRLLEQKATGLVERAREEYRVYRDGHDSAQVDWGQDDALRIAAKEASEKERTISKLVEEKSEGKGGKRYKKAGHYFWAHVFMLYRKAAETVMPAETHAQTMETITVAAQAALTDMDRVVAEGTTRHAAQETRTSLKEDFQDIYTTGLAALRRDPNMSSDIMGVSWEYSGNTSKFTHYFTGKTEYFGARDSKGQDSLYSVSTEANTRQEISRTEGESDEAFKTRTFATRQEIQSQPLPEKPDGIVLRITDHLTDSKTTVQITRKVNRKGIEKLYPRIWVDGQEVVFFVKSQWKLVKDILHQQLAL